MQREVTNLEIIHIFCHNWITFGITMQYLSVHFHKMDQFYKMAGKNMEIRKHLDSKRKLCLIVAWKLDV